MHVVVVGAGITGLTLAHELRRRNVEVTLLEAAAQPGGVVRSLRVRDQALELGPQRARLTPELGRLVEVAGLRDDVLLGDPDAPLYVLWEGTLRPVPRGFRELLTTNLLTWRGKLRVLAEPLVPHREPAGTARAYLAHRVGEEAVERMADPLLGGFHGTRLAHQPVRPALDRVLAAEDAHGSLLRAAVERLGGDVPPPFTLRQGLASLPRGLARTLRGELHLETRVTDLHASGDELTVETAGGSWTADHVIVTVPAAEAATILRHVAPVSAGQLGKLRYAPLALVHLATDDPPHGYGVQVPRREGLRTRGFTWTGGLFPERDGLVTAFLGGTDDASALDLPDDELAEVALRDHEEVTGRDATVLHVHRLPHAVPTLDASWNGLALPDLPEGLHLAANYLGPMGVPGRVREATVLADELVPPRKG